MNFNRDLFISSRVSTKASPVVEMLQWKPLLCIYGAALVKTIKIAAKPSERQRTWSCNICKSG